MLTLLAWSAAANWLYAHAGSHCKHGAKSVSGCERWPEHFF